MTVVRLVMRGLMRFVSLLSSDRTLFRRAVMSLAGFGGWTNSTRVAQ
jgi:hypothetical protein